MLMRSVDQFMSVAKDSDYFIYYFVTSELGRVTQNLSNCDYGLKVSWICYSIYQEVYHTVKEFLKILNVKRYDRISI
jgi:hypothetical protein